MFTLLATVGTLATAGAAAVIARRRWWRMTFDGPAQVALANWAALASEFIARPQAEAWKLQHASVLAPVRDARMAPTPALARLRELARDLEKHRTEANADFTIRRLSEDEAWLDSLLSSPLAECQRLAVVADEDNLLVLAGAGSGKTATLVSKIAYTVRHRLAQPEEILAIAFNRKARDELAERIPGVVNAPVRVSTFHALGLEILRTASDAPEKISPWVDQPAQRLQFLRDRFAARLLEESSRGPVRELLTTALADLEGERPASIAEAAKKARAAGLKSLGGVRHKSLAEVAIANWLTLNGIPWEYEADYPLPAGERRRYRPDFRVAGGAVYLEHFGVTRDGKTAPWIDAGNYRREMDWKRALHRQRGTTLVETFEYEFRERKLLANLESALRKQGIVPRALSAAEIDALLDAEAAEAAHLLKLFDRSISLVRGNVLDRDALYGRCQTERDRLFLDLALWLVGEYEKHLSEQGEIDFDDMIMKAAEHVRARRWHSPWKYILVDEFQDISGTRLALVQALRSQRPDSRLFVVGDDWQSIYGFTGSNIAIIRDLEQHVGETAHRVLDLTYRFHQGLVEVSSQFIQANPAQLRRAIRSTQAPTDGPAVIVRLHDPEAESRELAVVLEEISAHAASQKTTVFVLGRYQFRIPADFHQLQRAWEERGLVLTYSTVHSGKGLEADYVIVVGADQGRLGFPSEVEDDPALRLILPEQDPFPHAEERRVFYVALTRARRRAYVLGSAAAPSAFLDELGRVEGGAVARVVTGVAAGYCSTCKCHSIVQRQGPFGTFWGCRNYPICPEKPVECPACHQRPLEFDETTRRWRCRACQHEERPCPRCRVGVLMTKSGKNGNFIGCNKWRPDGGCTYTESVTTASRQP